MIYEYFYFFVMSFNNIMVDNFIDICQNLNLHMPNMPHTSREN